MQHCTCRGAPGAAARWLAIVAALACWLAVVPQALAVEESTVESPGVTEPADGGTAESADVGVERLAELTEIQAQAEALRGLRFKQPPTYQRLRQDEVAPYFHEEVLEEFDEADLNNLLLAYEKLGLISSADGLLDDLVEGYANEVVAFYDQDTDVVHLIGDLKVPAVMQRIAELHELVHALQDQHFDLDSLPLTAKHTDPSTAALALVEGDAMVATVAYSRTHARLALSDLIETAIGAASDAPTMPYLFEHEMTFVYTNGFDLANALYKRGGWDALAEAFAAPPASTEQVLHYRAKYLEARDEPTPVELPDLSATLGPGWKLVADDVLGELYVQTLFRLHLSALRAGKPSRGWDGDLLQFYRVQADGVPDDAYVLVWSTVWDTARDAREFAEAYEKVARKRLGTSKKTEESGPIVTITGTDRADVPLVSFVAAEGTRVLIVEGCPESAVRAALKTATAAAGAPAQETQ